MKHKVRITVTESTCRSGLHSAGDTFVVDDLCPPVCHELWQMAYPMVYALGNGADLDHGNARARQFEVRCPDSGRVVIYGEVTD